MKFLSRSLHMWMAWVLPRPLLVLSLALLGVVGSLYLASQKLGIQTDQLELISPDHPLIALANRLEPFNFGEKTVLVLVVEAPAPDRAVSFVKELVPRILGDREHFQEVVYRVDPEPMKQWALLYSDVQDLIRLRDRLEESRNLIEGIARQPDLIPFLRLVNQEMASSMVDELFTGFLDDLEPKEDRKQTTEPMDLKFLIQTLKDLSQYLEGTPHFTSPWDTFFSSSSWNLELEGYFWESGKKYLLLFVVPEKEKEGFSRAQKSLDRLRFLIREVQANFPDVQAGVTGQAALNNDQMTMVLKDMTWATWLSLLGVLVILQVFFRGVRRSAIEVTALGTGICWTLGWTTLFVGHLNILSVVFAPLLCGLGVDYGIHWFARYEEEERHVGLDRKSLLRRVAELSGPGILLAGLSAAFSFLPLVLTGFRGLMELGFITGAGILLILFADFTVLPALTLLFAEKRWDFTRSGSQAGNGDLFAIHRPHAVLVLSVAGVLCVLAVGVASRVRFDLNPLKLQPPDAEAVVWEKKLIQDAQRSPLYAAVFAESLEEVRAKSSFLETLPVVSEVESILTLLPENQEEKIPVLRSLLPKVPPMQKLAIRTDPSDAAELAAVLERIRFKMQAELARQSGAERLFVEQMALVREISGEIIERLSNPSSLTLDRLQAYRERFQEDLFKTWDFFRKAASTSLMTIPDVPSQLRDWFYQDGLFLIRIYPKGSVWEEDALSAFVRQLQAVEPEVVGDPVSLYVFASAFRRACLLASIYAVVAIFILLMVTLRHVSLALMAMVPLLVGTVWTVGIMGFAGVDFNLANSMFMPVVVGAGVEYGVIILQRWLEGNMEPGHLPASTAKGVIAAALTTTVGYGMLMISRHRGIFSLGFVACAGSILVLLAAIVLLPALLAAIHPAVPNGRKEPRKKV
ncbi:MAG: MMPL family transporter [Syntrophobacteraceae bacterium]|nr:MMPL family transporter [Syntrophobacteraceae bacterium]